MGAFEVSFAQKRLWLLDRLLPLKSVYNLARMARLNGLLDVDALRQALHEVVQRHQVLRSRFALENGEPVQAIVPELKLALEVEDLSALPEGQRRQAAQQQAQDEARAPFDLEQGPLMRARLLRLGEQEHWLLLTFHHIVSDDWSMGVLWRELSTLYDARRLCSISLLAALPVQYADYAQWQREWLQEAVLERQLAYWKQALAELSVLRLPTDRVRPAQPSYRGRQLVFALGDELTRSLRALGHREGTTFFTTLLAALQVLLYRYTGQEDVAVGVPVAGRRRPDDEGLIGFFVNTLVLRGDLSGDLTFKDYLGRVRLRAQQAYAHQDIPFEMLVEKLHPKRDSTRNPLFQVMLNKWNPEGQVLRLTGLEPADVVTTDTGTAMFDLAFTVVERQGQCKITIEYATDLFDAATIERLAGHFTTLLEAIVVDPEQCIGRLPLLTEAERHKLLVEWNDTAADYPRDRCIHQLFEAQAARTPEAVAVVFEDRQLTYGELNTRANQLAHHLIALGVGPEVLVGICLERSLEMIVGLLGILKAGGAYVPLDPSYPQARLAFVLEDTRAPVLLTQQGLLEQLPQFDGRILCLDRDWPEINTQSRANPSPAVTSQSLAYVIYTSGSTGRPKGVLVPHQGLTNVAEQQRQTFGVEASDRVLQFASPSFDASVFEIVMAFRAGAMLQLATPGSPLAGSGLFEWLRDRAITHATLPPSVLEATDPVELPALKTLIVAGEACSAGLVRRWSVGRRLFNAYGPTEATIWSTVAECVTNEKRPSIGRPIANTRIYILDQHGQPVPVGVTGELYVGGDGVGRGYLNRPGLTAERFVSDPFATKPAARLYRTGDLARYLPDGNIEFLGRFDDQVKIRGFRIELGEIEMVLAEHPAVRQAVVVVREDTPGEKRLVAYVVPVDASLADIEPLRACLRERLPDYMRPAAYVVLERLPLAPNGKIDRKALPAPDAAAYANHAFEAPVGEIETTLAQIWADVLKLERVGRHDHFFELGGHSLLAVSTLERMRQAGLHADVRALFVTPTLTELAAAVGGDDHVVEVPPNRIPPACDAITPEMLPLVQLTPEEIERVVAAVPGGAANVQDIYPLAPLQEGILFHHRMATEGDPYLLSTLFGFDSRARLQRYLQALQAVIDRHDILRTAVLWEGLPEPVQVVWRQAPLAVEEVSIATAAGDVALQLRARFDPRHFRLDVRQAPLIRVFIAHDAANARWVMLQLFHHLSIDHTTVEVMQREIQAHLLGQADQLPAPLPFRNLVAQARLGVSKEEHKAFFQKMLGDVDEPTAPFGLTDVHGDGSDIAEARRQVDASLALRLRERARALGVSAASVFHLAWAQVLARVSGRDDVVFGTVLFGRMQGGSGADQVLGLFINTLPVRIRVSDEGVQDSIRHTHALLGQLLRHEHAPLALAQRCSAVAAPAPLFSALLNYRHTTVATQARAGTIQALEGIVFLGHVGRTNYPMILSVDDVDEGFALTAQVQSPIDPQRVCAFMHTALEQLVGALESAPATPLRRLDVLPASERALLPDPAIPMEAPSQQSVVAQVMAWARSAPERIAVSAAGKQWTYAELTGRAMSLSTALQHMGIGRGDVVAIIGPPGFGLVGAMLGVFMSGCAFLTIDPALPAQRKKVMLGEARAKVVCLIGQPASSERYLEADDTLTVLRTDLQLATHLGVARRPDQPWSLPAIYGDDPAYVFFTSGSTGQPKAILGCHKGLSHFLHWQRRTFAIGAEDRVSQLTGLTFDPLLRDVFLPLTSGATLCVPAESDLLDTIGWIRREGVTVVHTTPTVMQSWLLNGVRVLDLPTLRWLFIAGEPLTDVLIGKWRRTISGPAQLVNLYGPTETTMARCFYTIPAEVTQGIQPIGLPLPESQALVLNAAGLLCGIGETGEIVLRTPYRSLGYLNLPEENERRFRPNPFRNDATDLVYFTGDLGRYRTDGLLEIAGRLDDQVKIRGVRVDPGEVTATLARHEAVRNCVVVGRADARGQHQLVCYVVADPGKPLDARELRAYLTAQLPPAFVPGTFVFLDALPVLPNGKVDRSALPLPAGGSAEPGVAYLAPRTPTESRLVEIWQEVLGVARVGISDNFFEVGGHSLKAMQLMSRIQQVFGVELPLRRMFEAPTIAELAGDLARMGRGPGETALERILREVEALTDEEVAHQLNGS